MYARIENRLHAVSLTIFAMKVNFDLPLLGGNLSFRGGSLADSRPCCFVFPAVAVGLLRGAIQIRQPTSLTALQLGDDYVQVVDFTVNNKHFTVGKTLLKDGILQSTTHDFKMDAHSFFSRVCT